MGQQFGKNQCSQSSSSSISDVERIAGEHERNKMADLMACAHLEAVATVTPPGAQECGECVELGSTWVHLRTCQTCGVTRCCDSSPNRHASKHARGTGHPVIASAERGERWLYCYTDDEFGEY